MADRRAGAHSRFNTAFLASLGLLFGLSPVRAELPTAQQLIRQVEEACREYAKETGDSPDWPLSELAQAQTYAGDYAGALRTARPIPGLWGNATLSSCWRIHFELTGTIAELPTFTLSEPSFDTIARQQMRVDAAKVLAKAGRLADAEKLLPQDREQDEEKERFAARLSLVDFHLFLAGDQAERGDKSGAVASVQRAWTLLERLPEGMRRIDWMETFGNLWLRLGNADQPRTVTEAAVRLTRDRDQKRLPDPDSALDWGRIGKLQARLGHNDRARDAFGEALRLVEAADRRTDDAAYRDELQRMIQYVQAVGQIGAWQFAAGLKAEATESYGKAAARVKTIVDDDQRDHRLLELVVRQTSEGDIEGSLKTVDLMHDTYWKVAGYCRCAETLAVGSRPPTGQELRTKAEALAGGEPEAKNSADMFVAIAEVAAKAGDLPAAKRCLAKALQVSRPATGQYEWIARSQVSFGLLDEAYETIRAIPQVESRALPLAELAREVAKREALARMRGADK